MAIRGNAVHNNILLPYICTDLS